MNKVSVCITTYNVEKYICQTLNSVLCQKTNFDFEIVIGEDKSTDGTAEILKKYQTDFPGKFRIMQNEKNLGMMPNFLKTLEACKGTYIAVMDGDDYWTDNYKLQKQFDFLEREPCYSLCWHDSFIVDSDNKLLTTYGERFKGRDYSMDFDLAQVIRWRVLGGTSTIFFRNNLSPFPSWAYRFYGTEVLLFILSREIGKLSFMSDVMSAYRRHAKSMEGSSDKIQKAERDINSEEILMEVFYPKLRTYFLRRIIWLHFYAFLKYAQQMSINKSVSHLYWQSLRIPKYVLYYLVDKVKNNN